MSRPEQTRAWWWSAFALMMVLQVVLLYVVSGPGIPSDSQLDKLGHASMFALPAFVAGRLARRWPWALLVLHALVSEPVQSWVTSSRQQDPWDTLADLTGIVLGALTVRWWASHQAGRRSGQPARVAGER